MRQSRRQASLSLNTAALLFHYTQTCVVLRTAHFSITRGNFLIPWNFDPEFLVVEQTDFCVFVQQDSSGRGIGPSQRSLYLTTHNTHTRQTSDSFFFILLFCLCTYFFFWIILHFDFCLLLFNTPNTNVHSPSGIRTRIPSKRSAADRCLGPLGHWD